jgi:hypothetical protein
VRDLIFSPNTLTLSWIAPEDPGGTGASNLFYDTLRSGDPADFDLSTVCVESDDDIDTQATDIETPLSGSVFHYLVRAENPCPTGQGTLGVDSTGQERSGRACP